MDSLITTRELADLIARDAAQGDVRILDATSFLPDMGRDAAAEYQARHIPGALFLNLSELKDSADPRPGMVPGADQFTAHMRALGLNDDSRVILYDDSPLHTSARAWWLLRLFGMAHVAILDGGLGKWIAEQRPVESGWPAPPAGHFTARRGGMAVADKQQMLDNLSSRAAQVVDARSISRFTGEDPEPRPGMAPGHIPGAVCLPYASLFAHDGTWHDREELRRRFIAAGVDLDRPVITTCGSGVTAADLLFALHLLGKQDVTLYDGSWSEWGADPATPKATGHA